MRRSQTGMHFLSHASKIKHLAFLRLRRRDQLSNFLTPLGGPPAGFIINGKWDGVDDALRGVYKEASEALGREFVFPKDVKK